MAVIQSTSAAQSFMIAMSLFPDVQRKAQEELDRVVGSDRLPEFGDLGDLLYIQAISLEAMRWMVVLPFAIFHRVIRDDEYNGYFIPKGSVLVPVSTVDSNLPPRISILKLPL